MKAIYKALEENIILSIFAAAVSVVGFILIVYAVYGFAADKVSHLNVMPCGYYTSEGESYIIDYDEGEFILYDHNLQVIHSDKAVQVIPGDQVRFISQGGRELKIDMLEKTDMKFLYCI